MVVEPSEGTLHQEGKNNSDTDCCSGRNIFDDSGTYLPVTVNLHKGDIVFPFRQFNEEQSFYNLQAS